MVKVDCRQYRKTMELLSLRLKLEKGSLDPRQTEEIKRRIKLLEKELGMG